MVSRVPPTEERLEVESHAVTDKVDENLELDKYSKDYVEAWAAKCSRSSYQSGIRVRDTIDLDGHGVKFVAAFRESAEECAAKGKLLPREYLGYLVLIMRNDVVHQYSHVSRAAYQCLLQYLAAYPYAAVGQDGTGHGQVVVCPESAWLPFFTDRGSFFSKYLMYEDMSEAGQRYGSDELGFESDRKLSGFLQKWSHIDEMVLHCINCALDSEEKDFNGDLLMFDYFVRVMSQDLSARLQLMKSIIVDEASRSKYFDPMKALLENSGLWRVLVGLHWNAKIIQQIVGGLIQLIADTRGTGDSMELAEDEPEDDSPAGACAFSKAGLSSMASTFLNCMLDLFGSMESLGGFLATSSYRTASENYRLLMDEYLVESFWTEKGYCKDPRAASMLLFSLKPRDALRMIGFVSASKFSITYTPNDLKKFGAGAITKVQALYDAMETRNTGSKDVETFYEIALDAVLESYILDISRTIRMCRTADHLALLVGCIAASLSKLVARGESTPTGSCDIVQIKDLLKRCINTIYDHETATNSPARLGVFGSMCLSSATLFVEGCV